MLLVQYVQAEIALERGRLEDARCERCVANGKLVPSVVVLEQVRDPKLAYNRLIGVCNQHYRLNVKAYVDHGWVVIRGERR